MASSSPAPLSQRIPHVHAPPPMSMLHPMIPPPMGAVPPPGVAASLAPSSAPFPPAAAALLHQQQASTARVLAGVTRGGARLSAQSGLAAEDAAALLALNARYLQNLAQVRNAQRSGAPLPAPQPSFGPRM
jgi:hypothetical protein